jgi:hypothetical protein
MSIIDLQVGATGPTHRDRDQHFPRARLGHGTLDLPNVLWTKEDRRSHPVGKRFLGQWRLDRYWHDVLRI